MGSWALIFALEAEAGGGGPNSGLGLAGTGHLSVDGVLVLRQKKRLDHHLSKSIHTQALARTQEAHEPACSETAMLTATIRYLGCTIQNATDRGGIKESHRRTDDGLSLPQEERACTA